MHAVGQLARARPENARYDGPAVAERAPHYHFRLAALDVPRLELGEAAKAEAVWAAVRLHILAEAESVSTYKRLAAWLAPKSRRPATLPL
jgi:phosphatidylethanolamine-binding protein (PEBP) family uncharacterized protein